MKRLITLAILILGINLAHSQNFTLKAETFQNGEGGKITKTPSTIVVEGYAEVAVKALITYEGGTSLIKFISNNQVAVIQRSPRLLSEMVTKVELFTLQGTLLQTVQNN